MKNKIIPVIFVMFFISLLSLNLVSSLFPISHKFVFDEVVKSNLNSNLFNVVKKYPDLAYAGSEIIDSSVLWYYSSKSDSGIGRRYLVTHDPVFCNELLKNAVGEREQSCAIGCFIHHAEDFPSHTIMVPYSIKHTFMPNSFIHVFSEQALDNQVVEKNPNIQSEVIVSLASYQNCTDLFKRTLQGEKDYYGVNIDNMLNTFITEIQKEKTFKPSWDNISEIPTKILVIYILAMLFVFLIILLLIFKRLRFKDRRNWFNWFSLVLLVLIFSLLAIVLIAKVGGMGFNSFVAIIKPISSFVPIGDGDAIIQKAVKNTQDILIQGAGWYTTDTGGKEYRDPSGQYELQQADRDIATGQYIIIGVLLLLLVAFLYFNFKGRGKQVKGLVGL